MSASGHPCAFGVAHALYRKAAHAQANTRDPAVHAQGMHARRQVYGHCLRAYLAQTQRVLGVLVHPCTRVGINDRACSLQMGTDSLSYRRTQGAVVLRLAGWDELLGQRRSERDVVAGIKHTDLRTSPGVGQATTHAETGAAVRTAGRPCRRARTHARTRARCDAAPCAWDVLRRLRTNFSRYLVP